MPAKTLPPADTVDELLKAMLILSRAVDYVIETRAVKEAAKEHLSSSKVQILRLLGLRGGQTCVGVARILGVTKPAVSQIIDSMVRAKLVVRQTSVSDRREVNLRLSKKGRDLFHAIRRQQRHYVRLVLRQLQDTRSAKGGARNRVDQRAAALDEISSALAQADQAFKDFCLQCGAHGDGTCVLVDGRARCLFMQYEDERG